MNRLTRMISAVVTVVMLASCEHKVAMLTEVHADGSLDKTVVLETKDPDNNMLGISPSNGWEARVEPLEPEKNAEGNNAEDEKSYKVSLRKHFPSAAAANAELATPSDTLFRVTSTFEKRFRWFYTYVYYADTYHALNHLSYPIDDYLTQEDYAFIDRLPAEGKPMPRADSIYLAELNRKIFDIYGVRAYFETDYAATQEFLKEIGIGTAWLDTLRHHKENLLNKVLTDKDIEDDFIVRTLDSLGAPLPANAKLVFESLIKPQNRMTAFMSLASAGKYQHVIHMPWNVVRTNADSVAGRALFWSPPSIKFLVKDYSLYAEARQMNYWAVGLSMALIAFSGYLLWRTRRA